MNHASAHEDAEARCVPTLGRDRAEDGERDQVDDPVQDDDDRLEARAGSTWLTMPMSWSFGEAAQGDAERDGEEDDADHVVVDQRLEDALREVVHELLADGRRRWARRVAGSWGRGAACLPGRMTLATTMPIRIATSVLSTSRRTIRDAEPPRIWHSGCVDDGDEDQRGASAPRKRRMIWLTHLHAARRAGRAARRGRCPAPGQ